jgi:hypothetical protein
MRKHDEQASRATVCEVVELVLRQHPDVGPPGVNDRVDREKVERLSTTVEKSRVASSRTPAYSLKRASSSAVEQGTLNPLVVGSNPSWLTV